MYSALVGALALLSIGILMAHAMEGLWHSEWPPIVKDSVPLAPDYSDAGCSST
jgi:hypothetical protein